MLADAGCRAVVTERSVAHLLPGEAHRTIVVDEPGELRMPSRPPSAPPPLPGDGAYVIYTSGSTGTPRGVVVPRSSLDNHMAWMLRVFPLGGFDRVLQRTSPCFDASVWELLAPLMAGARMVVLPSSARRDPAAIAAHLVTEGITVLQVVPTLLRALLDEPDLQDAVALRRVFSGGEVLTAALREGFHTACRAELVNLYGPTEATIDATSHVSVPGDDRATVPIGRPIDNVAAHVLDGAGNPVPIGVPGRLHLGGAALALGYHGHPRATAARFRPDPFGAAPGGRLLDTGDVVRYRSDGELEFLGRADAQVKVRGHRIEPSEVEAAIDRAAGVDRSLVTVATDDAGESALVAYLVPSDADALGAIVGEAEHDVVDRWREVYREVYAGVGPDDEPELNTVGWVSSFDGARLPADAMTGWRDETVERIRELRPRSVLEIGCGTGLILTQLAPGCERYVGTDFAAEVIELLAAQVGVPGSPLAHVELHRRTADDVADLVGSGFDVVVLNSVVQYFPGARYLREVLERAVRCVRPGGAVFVGDVRNLALLDAFHVAVELARAGPGATVGEVVAAAERRVADEEELVLDPGFFVQLAEELDGV
jgi:amino acid adenylation domain-containing protein